MYEFCLLFYLVESFVYLCFSAYLESWLFTLLVYFILFNLPELSFWLFFSPLSLGTWTSILLSLMSLTCSFFSLTFFIVSQSLNTLSFFLFCKDSSLRISFPLSLSPVLTFSWTPVIPTCKKVWTISVVGCLSSSTHLEFFYLSSFKYRFV